MEQPPREQLLMGGVKKFLLGEGACESIRDKIRIPILEFLNSSGSIWAIIAVDVAINTGSVEIRLEISNLRGCTVGGVHGTGTIASSPAGSIGVRRRQVGG